MRRLLFKQLAIANPMKKIFVIVLVMFYAIFTAGVNIMVHTCGGESEAMIATTSFEDPCGCSDEMSGDRCCTTEVTTVKLNEAQQSILAVSLDPVQVTMLHSFRTPGIDTPADDTALRNNGDSDPSPPDLDLHILHSVFLL